MTVVTSHPTRKNGGNLIVPSWGTAHLVKDGRVVDLALCGATLEILSGILVNGESWDGAEVWFEQAGERSH